VNARRLPLRRRAGTMFLDSFAMSCSQIQCLVVDFSLIFLGMSVVVYASRIRVLYHPRLRLLCHIAFQVLCLHASFPVYDDRGLFLSTCTVRVRVLVSVPRRVVLFCTCVVFPF
jgi:hypothetical protein